MTVGEQELLVELFVDGVLDESSDVPSKTKSPSSATTTVTWIKESIGSSKYAYYIALKLRRLGKN